MKNLQTALLGATGLLFFALYLILAWNNRFPYEDYTFIALTKASGPAQAMIDLYHTYSARWSAHTCAFYFSQFFLNNRFLFLFNIISLLLLIASFYLLLKKISEEVILLHLNKFSLFLYAVLFTVCLFFSSYSIGETWFWYMVNWMYLWSILAGNILLWSLLSGKMNAFRAFLILTTTAYIAGAAESYAMIWIGFLIALLYFKKRSLLPALSGKMNRGALMASLLLLSFFYAFTLAAPGTWERKEMLTDATVAGHFIMTLKAYGIIVLYKTPPLVPYLILFSLPWALPGLLQPVEKKTDIKKIAGTLFRVCGIAGLLIFVFIFPASWILYDVPPSRALSQISLLLSILFSGAFFFLGAQINFSEKVIRNIVMTVSFLSVLVIGYHAIDQQAVTGRYSQAYDERIGVLSHERSLGRNNTVSFDPLPPSGMLYSDDLSKDSLINNFFESAYGLKFHTAVK